MKYLQKDVCRLLNIKRETLRHYEKEGLIVPEIDPLNQYRRYDVEQVYLISECKRYQANEFSLSEIREMLQKDTLEKYIERMEQKQSEFEAKRDYYAKLSAFNLEYVNKLKEIPLALNRPAVKTESDIFFVKEREGENLSLSPESFEANESIRTNLQDTFMMGYFPDGTKNYCEWGFGRRTQTPAVQNGGMRISCAKVIACTIDTGDEVIIRREKAQPLYDYAEANGLKPAGPLLMLQLVRVRGAGENHRYMETLLPLE